MIVAVVFSVYQIKIGYIYRYDSLVVPSYTLDGQSRLYETNHRASCQKTDK